VDQVAGIVDAGAEEGDEGGTGALSTDAAGTPAASASDREPPDRDAAAASPAGPSMGAIAVPGVARTFRLVRVVSAEVELPDQYPVVVLEDIEEHRLRIAFRIGIAEGVALAHALGGTCAPRPLTQELFSEALDRFGIEVLAVRLTGRTGSTYLAELDLSRTGRREVIPCRPSDGLCLALRRRTPAPVLADDRLFTESGDVAVADAKEGAAEAKGR